MNVSRNQGFRLLLKLLFSHFLVFRITIFNFLKIPFYVLAGVLENYWCVIIIHRGDEVVVQPFNGANTKRSISQWFIVHNLVYLVLKRYWFYCVSLSSAIKEDNSSCTILVPRYLFACWSQHSWVSKARSIFKTNNRFWPVKLNERKWMNIEWTNQLLMDWIQLIHDNYPKSLLIDFNKWYRWSITWIVVSMFGWMILSPSHPSEVFKNGALLRISRWNSSNRFEKYSFKLVNKIINKLVEFKWQ